MKKNAGIFFSLLFFFLILELALRVPGSFYGFAQTWLNNYDLSDQSQIRILCLGESTTAWGLNESYPKSLERELRKEFPGKNIVVINAGASGANTTFFKKEVSNILKKYRPHIVTTMLGVNDSWALEKTDEAAPTGAESWLSKLASSTRIYRLIRISKINAQAGVSFWGKPPPSPLPPSEPPPHAPPFFLEAFNALEGQDYETAIRKANEHLAQPGHQLRLQSFTILAKSHLALGQIEAAENFFAEAFRENDSIHTFLDANNSISSIEPRTPGLKELLVRILKRGIKKYPRDIMLTTSLALVYTEANDFEPAKQWLKRAIQLDPNIPDLYKRLGSIYLRENNLAKAEATLKTAAALPPRFPRDKIFNSLPLLQLQVQQGKTKEAEALIAELESTKVHNPLFESLKKQVRGEIPAEELNSTEIRPMSSFLKQKETKINYLAVVKATKEYGAVPVAVQYPRQSLEQLKELLDYDAAVVFVGNEQNFERALRTEPYENLFYDNFAENFGHFTPNGAKLVAEAILTALKEKQILKN